MLVIAREDIPAMFANHNQFSKGMVYFQKEVDGMINVENNSGCFTFISQEYFNEVFMEAKENLIVIDKDRDGVIITVDSENVQIYFPDTKEMETFTHKELLEMKHKGE